MTGSPSPGVTSSARPFDGNCLAGRIYPQPDNPPWRSSDGLSDLALPASGYGPAGAGPNRSRSKTPHDASVRARTSGKFKLAVGGAPQEFERHPDSVRTIELLRSGLAFRGRADQVLLEIVPWIMM
jgi:hypothetical protein